MEGYDVVLADGASVHIRQMSPGDADAVVAMHGRFSERTRYLRFFSPYPRIPPRDLERFVNVDHHDREALVAELGDNLIGVGRYERLGAGADEAEIAFVVEDAHQGRGIGSALLEHLAAAAQRAGIARFVAEVLPVNGRMLRVFADAGYEVARKYADGVVHLTFPIAPTRRSIQVQWDRERRAEAASMTRLLHPRSVAVFGARADGTGMGAAMLRNLRDGGFSGSIIPVHRTAATVEALPAVAALEPETADLALIVVPAPAVPEVVARCAAAGVAGVVVVSAGFDEHTMAKLVRLVHLHGMRLIGPTSIGIANSAVGLNATLTPILPAAGRVGFFSQSASLGIALLAEGGRRGIGLSTFVSAGDRADVSGNDLLQYWHGDAGTDAVLVYLESFGNPRKFARIARQLTRQKPVVALASAARRHGAPLDEHAVSALFASSGVIRVGTVAEMFDVALLVSSQPLPIGHRLGVVCDAEAFATLAGGVADAAGLSLVSVRSLPLGAGADQLAARVAEALADPDLDALLIAYAPPVPTEEGAPARVIAAREAVAAAAKEADKPVLAVYPAGGGAGAVPAYSSVEEAVRALGRVAAYAAWRRDAAGEIPPIDEARAVRTGAELATLPEDWVGVTPEPLSGHGQGIELHIGDLLGRYEIRLLPGHRLSGEPDEVAAAAGDLGFPVVLKVASVPWRHRVDLGTVRFDLANAAEVARAHSDLRARFGPGIEVVVQKMAPPGVACVVRIVDDPAFGPVVGFGLGGVATELLGDLAWCPTPLTDREAERLVRAPRAAALLHGYRGAPVADVAALAELVLRVGQLATEQPRILRLSLNPVLAHEHGLSIVNADLHVARPLERPDTGPRRLD